MRLPGAPILAATVSMALFLAGVLVFETMTNEPNAREPREDVRDLRCVFVSASGRATVYATIVNSTDEPRDYEVQVNFVTRGGVRVGSEFLVARAAEPGREIRIQTAGAFVAGSNPDRCEVA